MLGSQSNDDGSSVRQGDLSSHCGPSRKRRASEAKEEKDPAKETLDGTALAEFFTGPGGRQTRAIFLVFGIPRDDGHYPQHRVNPSDKAQSPTGNPQAKARAGQARSQSCMSA